VESLLQEGISTDFLYERNKLMIFLVVLVILGFYLFFVVNFKAQMSQTTGKPPSKPNYTAEIKSPMRSKTVTTNEISEAGKNSSIVPNTSS
jgi:cytoskeletal protein RodZ